LEESQHAGYPPEQSGRSGSFFVCPPFSFSLFILIKNSDSRAKHLPWTLRQLIIEVSGTGIILWDDFWKALCQLLTGTSFQSVLEGLGLDDLLPLLEPDSD
jgi:PAS domain-containing protein